MMSTGQMDPIARSFIWSVREISQPDLQLSVRVTRSPCISIFVPLGTEEIFAANI